MDFETIIGELTAEIHRLNDLLAAERAQNEALLEQVKKLTERIEELTHKKNSSNSSTPPSADHFDKPNPKSLRGKSDKKSGGQKGHKGSGMKIDRKPDEVVSHLSPTCERCPNRKLCNHLHCGDTRYVYEAVVETKLVAHKVMNATCPLSGEYVNGTFPEGINGTKQYGEGVFGLVLSLLTVGYMSVDRIKKLLNSLRIPISTGAIQDMLARGAERAKAPVNFIKEHVTNREVVHFDETGIRVSGGLDWLHCACSGHWRFYTVQERRGEEGMDLMGVLPNFKGIAVHDFWSSYKKFKEVIHAMCCQHLERELVYAEETGNQEWAGKLKKLLQGMCHAKNTLSEEGRKAFTDEELRQYMAQYDAIVAEGIAANPLAEKKPGKRGRLKRGKIRCLLDRFLDCKDDILRFATDWRVPYTNNAAEQAIRFAKVKEKVSGCFRTKKGADQFARVLSFLSTAVNHGISSFDACISLYRGTALSMVQGFLD